MLDSLHIENIAVIERADVEFSDGFNVLTGETGAGKSILIDSINAVLGMRASKELIRTGCERACVNAVFRGISKDAEQKLNELGFSSDDGDLSVSRVITENKSSVKINGISTTASVVRELAPFLINIHGQHDSQALLDPTKHYIYIDLLAENEALLNEYRSAFADMQKTRRRLKQLSVGFEQNEQKAEMLRFQIKELSDADIRLGEIDRLKKRRAEIDSAKDIVSALQSTLALLESDDEVPSVLPMIDEAANSLDNVGNVSDEVSALAGSLYDVREKIDEIRDRTERMLSDFDFDAEEIEQLEQRLDMYYNFSHKYGKTEQEMLDFLSNAKAQLKEIDLSDSEIVDLQSVLPEQVEKVKKLGALLTNSRKKAGEKFGRDVAAQLDFLDMPKVRIIVDITPCAYSRLGADKVEMLISTNPGEPPKPLSKIASGGEMSRIMLSIKNVLADTDPVDTLIFDEIDTGISGKAAAKVGDRLKNTARSKQVICVTHLAQIAANADNHLLIKKNIVSGRASTEITALDYDGRRRELARIIGADVTDATLSAADEMLENACVSDKK